MKVNLGFRRLLALVLSLSLVIATLSVGFCVSASETDNGTIISEQNTQGWQSLSDGSWVYYGTDGKLVTGWKNDIPGWEGKWFYFDKTDGIMKTGFAKVDNILYCFGSNGVLQTGWQVLYYEGSTPVWAYFTENGVKTGWHSETTGANTKWYYLDHVLVSNGAMSRGWRNDIPGWEGKWFYFNNGGTDDGVMAVGQAVIGGVKYLFESNGVMRTGWYQVGTENAQWMYFGNNGAVAGWQFIDNKWYYFDKETNIMLTGRHVIDGKVYTFASSGELL